MTAYSKHIVSFCAAALFIGVAAEAQVQTRALTSADRAWNSPTPWPWPTQVQPQLNVSIAKETEEVNFVNTNNDPFVYTRVYVLKHADPYEIRPYIMSAVRSRRIDSNDTKVEAIKFMDGTGMLIVSAEQYHFEKSGLNGMGIDKIIEMLDKPELSSNAGRKFFLYFPKYYDANSLATLIRNVGLTHANDVTELQGGIDAVRTDVGLNAMFFYSNPSSVKNIKKMLAEYDGPTTEAVVKYSIYELEYENDGNIGVDFQAWKNGPGADLFAAAARYSNGWDFVNNTVAQKYVQSSHTTFINFNPKWNSKYLDFLVSKSKAKVVTSGSLSIMNNVAASISSTTRIPVIENGAALSGNTVAESARIGDFTGYTLAAIDQQKGLDISVFAAGGGAYAGPMVATRTKIGNRDYYTLEIDKSGAYFQRADGKALGRICKAYDVTITDGSGDVVGYSSDYSYSIAKDKARDTRVTEYGFVMNLTPQVAENATTVVLEMTNTNLIGFKSNGEPRTSKTELKTQIMLDNSGKEFYIGGMDKKALVRSVSKVPWLGDIPVLGWVFSAESEVVKKTQLVAVLEVRPVAPDTAVTKDLKDLADSTVKELNEFGIKTKVIDENEYGFDQYLLDKDK